jgi:hypothetical protein
MRFGSASPDANNRRFRVIDIKSSIKSVVQFDCCPLNNFFWLTNAYVGRAISAFRAQRSPIGSRGLLASRRCVTWRAGGSSWQLITCAAATCRLRTLPSKWVTSRELPSTERSSAVSESRQPPGVRTRPQQMWVARPIVDAFDGHCHAARCDAGGTVAESGPWGSAAIRPTPHHPLKTLR